VQPENPESYSTLAQVASWPATAILGQPGAHLCAAQERDADTDPSDGAGDRAADEAGTSSALEAIPDAEPTIGSKLLDELRAQIAQFVILPSSQVLDAIVLWVVATHLQSARTTRSSSACSRSSQHRTPLSIAPCMDWADTTHPRQPQATAPGHRRGP
jgi:hypothetical protein